MKAPTLETIEDVIAGCCPNPRGYCLLKEVVKLCGVNNRVLEQMNCIEKFRYERNEQNGGKMDLLQASKLWEEEGFAKRFSQVYEDGMKNDELYKQIMNRKVST